MLKTISAALLAVSVLAAPALAAGPAKTDASAGHQGRAGEAGEAERAERQCQDGPPSFKHARHHRAHKHMGALKTHKLSKVSIKHAAPAPPSAAETDPRGVARPHCPAAPGGYQARPAPLLPQWWRAGASFPSRLRGASIIEMRIPFAGGRSRTGRGLADLERDCIWGYQRSVWRSCCCRSCSRPARAARTAETPPSPSIAAPANQPFPE